MSHSHSPDITSILGPACKLRMTVSGGFYVRSLCYDLGMKLESGAYMAELVRIKQGQFRMEDAVEWKEFVEGGGWEDNVVRILKDGDLDLWNGKGGTEEEPAIIVEG